MNKYILALSIITFTAGTAFAQASFETVDVDASGGVSLAEANEAGLPWTQDQFTLADRDGDGVLSAEEFAEATQ